MTRISKNGRTPLGTSIDKDISDDFNRFLLDKSAADGVKLDKNTFIEEAIVDLLIKYGYKKKASTD